MRDLERELYEEDKIKEDEMHRLLARKKSSGSLRRKRSEPSLITQSSATPSDQRPREEKSAPYKHARYELQLRERGIFMCKHEEDVTDESKTLCQKLLETPQTLPKGSLFADDLFEETCEMIRNRNEKRVIRDIAQLIVPSAEILAVRGAKHLRILTETANEGWNNSIPLLGPRPQPDYGLGFKRESFNQDRLRKLQPLIGELDDQSLFAATYNMYLPFLTAEVKCGAAALDVADRQNAHSVALALRGLVELFRLVGREKELHREINGFSLSHNDEAVRIYGYYAVINGIKATFHRHPIRKFNFTELDGKEKWTAYTFIKNVYDIWSPPQFERICSVIDELNTEQDFELSQGLQLQISETSGPSQQLEDQDLAEASSYQSSQIDLQQITPDTSTRLEKPAFKKKKKEKQLRKV
ncbi:hypothetical protein LTR04_005265 [Oleoguttula sp. CCFEE 6159]|nr:hypothetical protein LTR04_005265 [Oleoguttula sp. CCFEE 6159]